MSRLGEALTDYLAIRRRLGFAMPQMVLVACALGTVLIVAPTIGASIGGQAARTAGCWKGSSSSSSGPAPSRSPPSWR